MLNAKDLLKGRIRDTDLERWIGDDAKLDVALAYAAAEITIRARKACVPPEYLICQVEGAAWYLGKMGVEGAASVSENGVSITYKDVPDWLRCVTPGLGVL